MYLYLLTPGVLIEKHYIRVAVLCHKTYYLSRAVSSESVFSALFRILASGCVGAAAFSRNANGWNKSGSKPQFKANSVSSQLNLF